jgi:hypothetical protein
MLVRAGEEMAQVRKLRGQRIVFCCWGFLGWCRLGLVCCLRASRAQLRQRVAEAGALGDWASHLGLNSSVRSSGCSKVRGGELRVSGATGRSCHTLPHVFD